MASNIFDQKGQAPGGPAGPPAAKPAPVPTAKGQPFPSSGSGNIFDNLASSQAKALHVSTQTLTKPVAPSTPKPAPVPTSQQPQARAAVKDTRPPIQATPYFPGQQPATHSSTGTSIFFRPDTQAPKPPSVSDLTFQNQVKAIGPDVIRQASNPRVAALHDVLGAATGIPSVVDAIRTHQHIGPSLVVAASMFPVGRLGRVAEEIAKVAGVASGGRTAAEAAAHIDEARAFWRAKMPNPPLETPALKAGEVTPETGGELGGKVRSAFTSGDQTVAEARAATAALQSAERGKRFAAGEAARERAGGGTSGQIASLREQQGALPYTRHPGLAGETSPAVEAMIRHVESLPTLREGEKLTAIESLRNWWRNEKPPTEGEQALIEHAFGKNVADAIATEPGFRTKLAAISAKAHQLGQEAFLLPRAMKSSGDVSAMFRQDLLYAISHPREFAKLVPGSFKSLVSEGHFQGSQDAILNDQNAPIHWAAKVPFTDIGHTGAEGVGNLGQREEQFASNLAEKMNLRNLPGMDTLGKIGTGPGDIVRASDRSYVGLLNPSRQALSNRLIHKAALAGEDLTDPKVVRAIGSATGALTGRGTLGPWLEKHAVSLNALLFSPRFAASRFNLLGFGGRDLGDIPGFIPGSFYANLYRASPTAAKEVAGSMRNLAIVAASVLYAAHKSGALVSMDPTNADFGKIRIGNTRVDILAGLQAPVRMMAQEILQKETSSQTGKVTHLGGSGFNALGRLDPAWKFASSKASPLPSLALQGAGLTQKMNKLTPAGVAQNLFEPLALQDAIQQYQATGSIPGGLGALLLSGTGFGIQNYKSPAKKSGGNIFDGGGSTKTKSIFDKSSGSSGGNIFNK